MGTVTTTDSLPVSGAAILVSFRPTLDALGSKPEVSSRELLPLVEPTTLDRDSVRKVWITDDCGETVRVLCDGDCQEAGSATWDGRDDEGLTILDGVYILQMELPDTVLATKTLVLRGYGGWDPAEGRAHARTDDQGRFRLSDECMGFGTVLPASSEVDPDPLGTFEVLREVDLYAVHPDGRQARLESVVFPEEGILDVNLVIPE